MKLHLASILEPENFGPGRIISIAYSEPRLVKTAGCFEPLVPDQKLSDNYKKLKDSNFEQAKAEFISFYTEQLDQLYLSLIAKSLKENKSIINILPFQDGDTLVSWERNVNYNYRSIVKEFLIKCGYEVEIYES